MPERCYKCHKMKTLVKDAGAGLFICSECAPPPGGKEVDHHEPEDDLTEAQAAELVKRRGFHKNKNKGWENLVYRQRTKKSHQ
tara:strand:- start:550 stop:798 length:249 start_codon:yes stop_codon:yes gene_type:complete